MSKKLCDRRARRRKYYLARRDKAIRMSVAWARNNPERRAAIQRRYCLVNAEKVRRYKRNYKARRRRNEPLVRLVDNLRRRLSHAIAKIRVRKSCRTFVALGCDLRTLARHLEAQFAPGMTWNNYGLWHVDHIIPMARAKTEEDIKRLSHYLNLCPLWAADNLAKGAK